MIHSPFNLEHMEGGKIFIENTFHSHIKFT